LSSRTLEKIVMDSDIHIRIHIRDNQASSLRLRVFFNRSSNSWIGVDNWRNLSAGFRFCSLQYDAFLSVAKGLRFAGGA
jgi:hypothetical protein